MEDVEQIVTFLEAWAVDQQIVARSNHPSQQDWFMARSEALSDAASEIRANAFREGARGFLTLRAPKASEPPNV